MVIEEANEISLLKQTKKKQWNQIPFPFQPNPIAFNSFSVSGKEIITNILKHEWNRLVTSDQCCWRAIGITTISILNLWNSCHVC